VGEIVRGVGHLIRSGWTPQRTILFVSFDAEEYGLVGSTEWGEDFADWIATHAVAYLNVDAPLSGALWFAIGSPLLTPLIRANALRVPHPSDANRSLWDARDDSGPFEEGRIDADLAASLQHRAERTRKLEDATGILPLGGGSDFVVFQHHLGVPAMDGGFTQTLSDAVCAANQRRRKSR
jgi:N-acetylated-alpha-linked acidic dipeptidase